MSPVRPTLMVVLAAVCSYHGMAGNQLHDGSYHGDQTGAEKLDNQDGDTSKHLFSLTKAYDDRSAPNIYSRDAHEADVAISRVPMKGSAEIFAQNLSPDEAEELYDDINDNTEEIEDSDSVRSYDDYPMYQNPDLIDESDDTEEINKRPFGINSGRIGRRAYDLDNSEVEKRPFGSLTSFRGKRPFGSLTRFRGKRPFGSLTRYNSQRPMFSWGRDEKRRGPMWGKVGKRPMGPMWGRIGKRPVPMWGKVGKRPGPMWGKVGKRPAFPMWGKVGKRPAGPMWGKVGKRPSGPMWGTIGKRGIGPMWGKVGKRESADRTTNEDDLETEKRPFGPIHGLVGKRSS